MIEDFCRFMVAHKAYYLLRTVPQLLNSGFLSQKTFDAITQKLRSHLEKEQVILKVNFEEKWKQGGKGREVKGEPAARQNVKVEEGARAVRHLVDPL